MKTCTKCGVEKPLTEFNKQTASKDGLTGYCKSCFAENARRYYVENEEKVREQRRNYYVENKDKIRDYRRRYRAVNKENICAYRRQYERQYRVTNRKKLSAYSRQYHSANPHRRLAHSLRSRVWAALKGKTKTGHLPELLGCSFDFLWARLESQFLPGMTRDNYGTVWHVDHILPCAEFHLQHSEEQEVCFHWTNLQPLFALDNVLKGNKII